MMMPADVPIADIAEFVISGCKTIFIVAIHGYN
jgi:hypothetical protein